MCYRKKTKCDVEGPQMVCIQCIRRKTKCVFPSQQQPQPQPQEKDDETQRYFRETLFYIQTLFFLSMIEEQCIIS